MKNSTFIYLKQNSQKKIVFSKAGEYVVFFHNLSGDLVFDIHSEGIDLNIFGLYTGQGKDMFKVTTTQLHATPSSKSNLLIKGVFDGESVFTYQGLIRIEKKANASHAYQKNQNILMSPRVFVSSKPDLEILANDVFCTHGSTTGRLNDEAQLYLQSRGLEKKEAEKILITGFIQDIFDKIIEKGYRNEIENVKKTLLHSYV